jgi:3-hydroxyisobutyrate dehydrogenase-like beta-hydroxyacid dehydrogenase
MNERIAVIGCGLMGSELARTFAKDGADVVVWNRTEAKARALEGPGIRVAATVADAVGEADLAVVSLASYEAAEEALDPVADWSGKTIVNLITGSPADAERAARWAAERDASYLEGAILCYPQDIATEGGLVVFSGPADVWERYKDRLLGLGGASHHVSDVVGGANVVDVAVVGGVYNVALGAFIEAAAYARACQVPVKALLADTENILALVRHSIEEAAEAIEAESFGTDQATIDVIVHAMHAWRGAMVDAGQPATLISAQLASYEAAVAAGRGDLGPYATFLNAPPAGD